MKHHGEPELWHHALAFVGTLAVCFVLEAMQHGLYSALNLIGFTVVCYIFIFGSMPYTPPPRRNS